MSIINNFPGGGGVDVSAVTAAANDVRSGKVIVDKNGDPIVGGLATRGEGSIEFHRGEFGPSVYIPAGIYDNMVFKTLPKRPIVYVFEESASWLYRSPDFKEYQYEFDIPNGSLTNVCDIRFVGSYSAAAQLGESAQITRTDNLLPLIYMSLADSHSLVPRVVDVSVWRRATSTTLHSTWLWGVLDPSEGSSAGQNGLCVRAEYLNDEQTRLRVVLTLPTGGRLFDYAGSFDYLNGFTFSQYSGVLELVCYDEDWS